MCSSIDMKLRSILILAVAGLLTTPLGAAAQTAKPASAVLLGAQLTKCPVPGAGAGPVAFAASMPAQPGSAATAHMAMRFELQQRGGGRGWLPVDGVPSFDRWEQSQPGRPGFVVTKKVKGLPVGGAYRAVVRFRWLDEKGAIVRVAKRVTAACPQPDTRPDLTPIMPAIVLGTRSDLVVYRVTVKNQGLGAAASSAVTVEVNGTVQPAQRIDPLAPKTTVVVTFQAPRCETGSVVRFTVDSAAELVEIDERDNVLERRCAASGGGSQPTARAAFGLRSSVFQPL